MNRTQEVIECSTWFFPAVIMSGWLAPVVLVINTIIDFFGRWFG